MFRQRPQSLAIHLKLVSLDAAAAEAYVGWTGMASASSLTHFSPANAGDKRLETIEIDPQYASCLGFSQDDTVCTYKYVISFTLPDPLFQVEIGLLYDLSRASTVSTEPVTPDDWEILVSISSSLMTGHITPYCF